MKLFIASPIIGEPTTLFFDSLTRFFARAPMEFVFRQVHGVSVGPGLARNHAAHEFLKTDCTDLLFIDADIGFTVGDVVRICAHDLDVVGGVYPLKREGKPTMVYAPEPDCRAIGSLVPCAGIGTGFLRIRRNVFERLIESGLAKEFMNEAGETEFDFFPVGVKDGLYMGEDIYFCRNWKSIGGTIFADLAANLGHEGRKVFRYEPEKTNHNITVKETYGSIHQ